MFSRIWTFLTINRSFLKKIKMEQLYKASVPLSESNRHYSFMLSSSDLDLLHFTIHPNTSGVGRI